jgi:hypothetical protein
MSFFSIVVQVFLLWFLKKKMSYHITGKINLNFLYRLMSLTQFAIISIVLVITFQSVLTLGYNILFLKLAIWISYIMSAILLALLTSRFLKWFHSNPNRVILFYLLATAIFAVNACFALIYVTGEFANDPDYVRPKTFGIYMLHYESGPLLFRDLFIITSVISFILIWTGTVLLMRNYTRRLTGILYWLIVAIPLIYFLSQFEPLFLNLFYEIRVSDPLTFNILYGVLINIGKPVGGILFGIAFLQIARQINHPEVSNYMIISAIGVLLLLTSNQVQLLVGAPFPPFGIISISFIGLSSFFVFVGIYASAVSVSQDSKLRSLIRKSVEKETRFLGNIGSAEMEGNIIDRIAMMTKSDSERMPIESGIEPSLTDEEVRLYIDKVLKEIRIKK